MSKVIKGGMVCTADRTWKADVLIEGEKIKQIGEDLKGDEYIDAEGAYVIPGADLQRYRLSHGDHRLGRKRL